LWALHLDDEEPMLGAQEATEIAHLVATLQGHAGVVWGVALSGDGQLVASSGWDGTVRVWDAATRPQLGTMEGDAGLIHSVALSRDGSLVASGGADGIMRLWSDGTLRFSLKRHSGMVYGVALSGDGDIVASGGWDGSVRVFDSAHGQLRHTLHGHTGAVW